MSFSTTFQQPSYTFFEGAISGTTRLTPFTVSLDQYQYPIDLRQYKASSQDTLKPSYSTSQVVDESLFNANGAWSRYRYNWNEGADQEFGDLRDNANPMRFKTSKGVDVWTEHELKLLHVSYQQLAAINSGVCMAVTSTRLYVGIGTALYWQDLADVGQLTLVNTIALTDTINAMTTDGIDLYVATGSNLYKVIPTATTTPVGAGFVLGGNFTNVAFVANRLLAAKSNVLYEISAALALGLVIKTHYQSTFAWTTIFNVGSRIYFGGFAGSRSELYSATTDSTGALVQSAEAAPLPFNELLRTGYSYSGSVLLATTKGIRLAQVGADGTLEYGPLIDKVGDVRCVTAEGRFAWCGWSAFQDGGSGVARLALDVSVNPLQPAYASDVYTDTNGIVYAVARANGVTVFGTSQGVYVESDGYYCSTGYLDQGIISFGTVEQKVLTSGLVRHTALQTDEKVTLEIQDSTGIALSTGTSETDGSSSYEFDLGGELVTDINPIIRLTSGSVLVGFIGPPVWVKDVYTPVLSSWRIRCFPVTPPVEQWVVPLILQSRVIVNGGMGQEMSMNVFDEAERIKGWWRTKQPLIYREGNTATRVRIDAYELAPVDWNDSGTFFEATMTVRLVTA